MIITIICVNVSVFLSVCQSLVLSPCLCPSVRLSVRLSVCPSVSLSCSLCLSLSVYLSVFLSLCLCLSLSLSLSLCLSLSPCLSVCLSLSVSLSPSLCKHITINIQTLLPSKNVILMLLLVWCLQLVGLHLISTGRKTTCSLWERRKVSCTCAQRPTQVRSWRRITPTTWPSTRWSGITTTAGSSSPAVQTGV